jgi:cell division protein FtsA
MKTDLVTVLDLGSTKVVCLAATPDGPDGMKIQALAVAPCRGIRRGIVADLDESANAVDVAIRRVEQDIEQEVSSVIVGISGAHTEGVNAQGFKPIVPRGRVITHQDVLEVLNHSRALVLPPDREQIQALPREFRVDGQRDVRKPVGMSGGKIEVVTYIVTGQTSAIQNIEKAVSRSGRRIDQMVLKPLASGIGVLTPEELELGAVVVDIGGGTTDIAVFTNGSIAFSASIPIGTQLVTSDLSKLLRTSPEEAERLKVESGSAMARLVSDKDSVEVSQLGQPIPRPMQRRVLCEIIESRMREIAGMVRQQIEKSGMLAMVPGGVVLTGGGAQMPGTDKLFDDVLKQLRVRVAEPDLGSRFPRQPGLATAVGLARFSIQCQDDIAPAGGANGWKERFRGMLGIRGGR